MPASKSIFMETTKVPVSKTCAEIENLLAEAGASQIWKKYENGQIEAIMFSINLRDQNVVFKLPFRWREVHALARAGQTRYKKTASEDQARRVAARVVLRWVQAQMALIQMGMARVEEVFLPYIMVDSDRTFADKLLEGNSINLLPGE